MSLKTRLRIAISLLMGAVVVVLALLYANGFLQNEFERTRDIAGSISGQIQAAALSRLETTGNTGRTPDEIRIRWLQTLREDALLASMLKRALENWPLILEIFITGPDGNVVTSTNPESVGRRAEVRTNIDEWDRQSPYRILWSLFRDPSDKQQIRALVIRGDRVPFVTTHVVLSSAVIRANLTPSIRGLVVIFWAGLMVSVLLALLLPNLVISPLEEITANIDRIAEGAFAGAPGTVRGSREIAAVYSKLDLLGQQYRGVREDAAHLRSNIEHLIDRLEQAVVLTDATGRLVTAGRNAGLFLGVNPADFAGKPVFEMVDGNRDLRQFLASAFDSLDQPLSRNVPVETAAGVRLLTVSCEPLLRNGAARPVGMLITLADAESRGKLQEELSLAERMTALGKLTRGVAHEIKNPLNAINIHLEVLRNRLEEQPPELDIISREISRLDRVVKTFLDFNRPVEPQMRVLDLRDIVQDIARLVQAQAKDRGIEIAICENGACPFAGDPDLVRQAVLNVVVNAIDAMAETGGKLVLQTENANRESALLVADSGPGIPPEIRENIFNLYFSTKKQGSGIGLAMASRFVQLQGGKLEFTSETGVGTTFRFSFPEAVSTPVTSRRAVQSAGPSSSG